ncbi:hypothetical protein APHAL10511_000977 [Amanita phalloides]|nr:hypothetical protein APHAL10511_000977 [Amanita phalloides]
MRGEQTHLSSQALLGLLRSIAPDAVPDDAGKLSEEDIKRINEKISELVGKDAMEQYKQDVNERGELVNEEGLPVIDINEPAEDAHGLGAATASILQEGQLVPLATLSEAQRALQRQELDRILDMLEEEERLEEEHEKERLLEEKRDLIHKKMKEVSKEKDRRNAAKEIQKRMGKSLLGKKSTSEGESTRYDKVAEGNAMAQTKKSVSFAVEPAFTAERKSPESVTWGDISLARLRPMNRPTLLSKIKDEKQPMRKDVVERRSVGQSSINQPRLGDSDDEFNPDAEGASADDKEIEQYPEVSTSESDATSESLEDLDYARHQREVALEYYAKRGIIGQAAAQALMSHSHAIEVEEEGFASDTAAIESSSSKPSISRFKASKLASSYNASLPQSTSLDGSVISTSSAKTLQRAIRMGRLNSNGQLVGSDSEGEAENEAIRQVLDLLSEGEAYNVGPGGNRTVYSVPSPKQEETDTAAVVNTATLPALKKPKASKFKVNRSQAGPPKIGPNQAKSISPTPTVSTSHPTASVVVERRPPRVSNPMSVTTGESSMTSTIVNPPSSTSPAVTSTQKQGLRDLQQSMTVNSPSFQQPLEIRASTSFPMIIIESPSFPPPRGAPPLSTTNIPSPNTQTVPRRPNRPPAVLSSVVYEKSVRPTTRRLEQAESTGGLKPNKFSRFLAERT